MKTSDRLCSTLAFLIIVGSFFSCVREEVVPYKKQGENKLVVIALLTPGERINVYVGKSQPFGKNDYMPSDFNEPNAIVTISDSHGRQQLLTLSSAGSSIYSCSQLDFPIMRGATYSIHVKSSFSEVKAETTVPSLAASWKKTSLSGPEEYYYYNFYGSWDAVANSPEVNYGVSLTAGNHVAERTNEGITNANETYNVKNEVYMAAATTLYAILLTRDHAFGEFSRKSDLTFVVLENLNSAGFTDIISGFKGVIPNAGNIRGGIGVFGSYLKEVRTIHK